MPSTQARVLMLDNYDSFTWNLYQYLCLLDAQVTVIRSGACSLDELIRSNPNITHLVISPGPGHPTTDSGISIPALKHYAGKIPILGVCMGLQCIYTAFGGEVSKVGDIVHGKTSKVTHDQKGLFIGIPQNFQATRYHSLAGQLGTLPPALTITSWTQRSDAGPSTGFSTSSIIMGVRHQTFTIEGVQYHPESILSEYGQSFLANFLRLRGGSWTDNPDCLINPDSVQNSISETQFNSHQSVGLSASCLPTILEKICRQRLIDVEQAKQVPGASPQDLRRKLAANLTPSPIDFYQRISSSAGKVALMAEIKRASPSKGSFVTNSTPTPPEIAISYSLAGASTISVLTEPTWFKGTLLDMLQVRLAIEDIPNRPAVLRKDFILDPYQIDEARCHGADTVLLIVACLTKDQLVKLFNHAKGLGIEPLVEVNNAEELDRALQIGARVIGINNRNLNDFSVDMKTTSKVVDCYKRRVHETSTENPIKEKEVIFCALSGISSKSDVDRYAEDGVRAVLVGESLMKASDKIQFVGQLLGRTIENSQAQEASERTLVKICGIKTPEIAVHAAEAGVDLIGFIFVQNSKRYVSSSQAKAIIESVRGPKTVLFSEPQPNGSMPSKSPASAHSHILSDWFSFQTSKLLSTLKSRKPLFVGVFQNANLEEIQAIIDSVPIDLVQLHGDEPIGLTNFISLPVIKTFHFVIDRDAPLTSKPVAISISNGSIDGLRIPRDVFRTGYHSLPLLDSRYVNQSGGGTGKAFDWSYLDSILPNQQLQGRGQKNPFILAGGLDSGNVRQGIERFQPVMVDVSGGVEEGGEKSREKITEFIRVVKGT